MAKIINVDDQVVSIGMDDGSLREVRVTDCNFTPEIGKKVEVYGNEEKTIVHEIIEKEEKPVSDVNVAKEGINISINNQNQNITQAPPQPTYANMGKVVTKWVYLVLAIFLGWAGAHKFYAGRVGTGVVYLLFCWTWIPAFIAFIEFIIACFKPADINGNIIV